MSQLSTDWELNEMPFIEYEHLSPIISSGQYGLFWLGKNKKKGVLVVKTL